MVKRRIYVSSNFFTTVKKNIKHILSSKLQRIMEELTTKDRKNGKRYMVFKKESNLKPFPETETRMIGWLLTKKDYQLEY